MVNWSEVNGVKIATADALDALGSQQTESLDAIITDPPYCSGGATEAARMNAPRQGVRSSTTQTWFTGDNMTTVGLVWLLRHVALEAFRLLKPQGSLCMFADWRMVPALAPALEASGLRWRNTVVWDKGSPGLGGGGFRPQHEMVLHFTKGQAGIFDRRLGNVLSVKRVIPARKWHPTEKPVELLADLIRATTPEGGIVADPFAGSGSLAEAALRTGRRAILSERDPAFTAAITDRLTILGEAA